MTCLLTRIKTPTRIVKLHPKLPLTSVTFSIKLQVENFYREKELILRLRRVREMEYKGNKVLIFPDYTPDVMQQRRGFSEVLNRLQELKVEHSVLFPVKLRLRHEGHSFYYTV